MATTDYFIQDSLVLDWIWERVKVDLEDTHIDIMVMNAAAYKKGWNMSVMFSGDNTSVLAGLGHLRHLASHLPDWAPGAGSLHGPGHTPRGESATGEATIDILFMSC